MTRLAALLLVLLSACALAVGTASPAAAHATLLETDPAEGAVLAEAPESVRLTFDEAVRTVPGGVQVFGPDGEQLEVDAATFGSELDVVLPPEPGEGTLVVVWRVVSDDGHPVSGTLSFSVGAPSDSVVLADAQAGVDEAPLTLSIARWLGYLGLLLVTGLVAFAVLFLRDVDGADVARQRVLGVARAAGSVAVVAWLAGLPLVASYQAGSLGAEVWATLPPVEYAATGFVVVGVLVALATVGRGVPALVAAAVSAGAPALSGHTRAATPELLVVALDVLHLLVAACWIGGLVALAVALPDLVHRGTQGAQVLTRFSTVAATGLALLAGSGLVMGWRVLGSWDALVGTTYGRLLLVKVAVALVVVGLAAWNRWRLLPAMRGAVRRRDRKAGARPVVRAVVAEAAVLVVVLALTGVLVDRSPEVEASVAPVARSWDARLGEAEVRATLDPATSGPTRVTLSMRGPDGEAFEGFAAPQLAVSSEEVDLGPVELTSIAPGSYAGDVVIPTSGAWTLDVALPTSRRRADTTAIEVEVE